MTNGHMNGHGSGGPPSWQGDPHSHDQMRAMQVHGQMAPEEPLMRKPQRLESLAAPSAKGKKKKRSNMMEQY